MANKDLSRMIVIIMITIGILAWTLINADGFIVPAFMYIILGGISIGWYLIFNKSGKKSYLYGIGPNYWMDILIGLGFGGGIILLQYFNIIGSVLIPYIPASLVQDVGRLSIIVLGAGVMETAFFFGLMIPFFDEKLRDFGINPIFIVAVLMVCILFPLFHATAYGQVDASFGSYVSAGIIAFGWGFLMKLRKSVTPLIVSHMLINFWILNQIFHYIGI